MDSNDPSESDSVPFLDPNAPPDDSAALSMKLSVFSANFSTEEVMVHAEDFPDLKEGDILQIFNPREKRYPRLVLQV